MTAITTICLVLGATAIVLLSPPTRAETPDLAHVAVPSTVSTGARRNAIAESTTALAPQGQLVALGVPADTAASATETARYVAARPELARQLAARRPGRSAEPAAVARLAAAMGPTLVRAETDPGEARRDAVRQVFAALPQEDRDWLAVLFPTVVGNLPGAPFAQRVIANRIRVAAALADARAAPVPQPPTWRRWWPFRLGKPEQPPLRDQQIAAYEAFLGSDRKLVYFDPAAAGGRGAWAELVGDLGPDTTAVGLLVPGGSAYLTSDNFDRYHSRATTFVDTAQGSLAMVVWAAGEFPGGWVKESMAGFDAPLGRRLAAFSHELRAALAETGSAATVTAIGHSYGGAVVGEAELRGLSVDRVLHVASAGTGAGVRTAADYPLPLRQRYSMTAPGDWISYVQGLSGPPGLGIGHGADPDTTPGFVALAAGSLPTDPTRPDEFGDPIGSLAATAIAGRRAHSTIFIPHSDAWWNMYQVMVGGPLQTLPAPNHYTPPADPSTRLPLAPLAGSLARTCHYTRRPRKPRPHKPRAVPPQDNPVP